MPVRLSSNHAAASIIVSVLASLALLAPPAASDARDGREMLPKTEQEDWLAIGRLNVAPGKSHCTATVIAPDMVLTAAHCVIDPESNLPYAVERLHFLAGFRQSRFAAHGRAKSVDVAEGYFTRGQTLRSDLAIVHLETPIADHIVPIPLAAPYKLDDAQEVDTYSYGHDRAFIVSVEKDCSIIARRSTVLLTDCEAVPGMSGAPLILKSASGPSLAGVIVGATRTDAAPLLGSAAAVAADKEAFAALLDEELW